MAEISIRCNVVSAVILEDGVRAPRILLLRLNAEHLRDEWCHVSGGIEDGESAWQAALREISEETGLKLSRLFSADFNEQFYEAKRNVFTIVPAFVAYVDASQRVRLNAEHSAFRWVTLAEAQSLVTFGGQRRLYAEIQQEFIERQPSAWHEIHFHGSSNA